MLACICGMGLKDPLLWDSEIITPFFSTAARTRVPFILPDSLYQRPRRCFRWAPMRGYDSLVPQCRCKATYCSRDRGTIFDTTQPFNTLADEAIQTTTTTHLCPTPPPPYPPPHPFYPPPPSQNTQVLAIRYSPTSNRPSPTLTSNPACMVVIFNAGSTPWLCTKWLKNSIRSPWKFWIAASATKEKTWVLVWVLVPDQRVHYCVREMCVSGFVSRGGDMHGADG